MRGKRGIRDLSAVSWLADSPLRESVRAVVAGEETSVEAVDSTVAKCQAARKALQLKKDQDDYAVLKQLYYRRSKLRKAQKKLREEAQRAREAKRAAIRAEEVAAGARLLAALEKRVRASPEHDLLKKGVALSQLKAMLRARRRAAREAAARQAEIDHAAALLRARLRFRHERVPLDVAARVLDEADCQTYTVTAEVETAHVRCFGSNGKELWDEKGVAAERLSKLASIDALADPETVEKLATALKSIVDEEDSDDDEFRSGLAEFGLDESDIDGFASAVVPRPAKHTRRVVACTTPTLQKIEVLKSKILETAREQPQSLYDILCGDGGPPPRSHLIATHPRGKRGVNPVLTDLQTGELMSLRTGNLSNVSTTSNAADVERLGGRPGETMAIPDKMQPTVDIMGRLLQLKAHERRELENFRENYGKTETSHLFADAVMPTAAENLMR